MRTLTLGLTALLAICALPVGGMLVAAPDGHLVGVTPALLDPSLPFGTFLVPGLALAVLIGGGALVAFVLTARRARLAPFAAALLGVVVMVWIALQIAMIRALSPLHAIIFAVGLTLALSGAARGAGIWLRWVLANAGGELVGLGAMMTAIAIAAPRLPRAPALYVPGIILLGALEGLAVGGAQAWVLRRAFPRLSARAWIEGTIAGAVTGWLLGMLPSLFLGGGDAPAAPLDDRLELALAAGLGLVAGPILAAFQLGELGRHTRRAGWWLVANALAWAAGMPVLFIAGGASPDPLRGAAFLAAAGAIVGAIHGLGLLFLLPAQALRGVGAIPAAGS